MTRPTLRPTLLPAAALLLGALAAGPGQACSPMPGYSVPTNLQLADDANAIILGEVTDQVTGGHGGGIVIRPVTALKGLMPGDELRVEGTMLRPAGTEPAPDGVAMPDFAVAHPEAYMGACIRRSFAPGTTALFFLRRQDAAWVPAGGPFSRWAEDVAGPQDPWLQLAALYAHAAQLGEEERTMLLNDQVEALQARAQAEEGEPAALAMASDIERSLAGPGEPLRPALPPPELDSTPADPAVDTGEPTGLRDVQAGIDAMAGTR